jgi:hypothetical protein
LKAMSSVLMVKPVGRRELTGNPWCHNPSYHRVNPCPEIHGLSLKQVSLAFLKVNTTKHHHHSSVWNTLGEDFGTWILIFPPYQLLPSWFQTVHMHKPW